MNELLIISVVCLFIVALNLSLIANARKANMKMERARAKSIDKNRPLFVKKRNINSRGEAYNYHDDYYKK